MPERSPYAIRITGLTFCASHFITFGRSRCEPIHGHTFRVEIVWTGPLGKHSYVVDFRQLRGILGEILRELDDRLLLPLQNPAVHITVDRTQVQVETGRFTAAVPRSACALLEIENVTAEAIAAYVARRLRAEAASRGLPPPQEIEVWVEEEPGCWAGYRLVNAQN